jgi:hypothetical protein
MSTIPPKADIVQHVGGSRDCAGRRRNIRGVASEVDFVALSADKNPREAGTE